MTTNKEIRNEVNNNIKNKPLNRKITQITSDETNKFIPIYNPEKSNNLNSAINKLDSENIQSSQTLNLNNKIKRKRFDRAGNPIIKKGKQRVTFIDKISQTNFVNSIKVESFKEYNKMEEVSSSNRQNNCCLIE